MRFVENFDQGAARMDALDDVDTAPRALAALRPSFARLVLRRPIAVPCSAICLLVDGLSLGSGSLDTRDEGQAP